MKNLSYIVILLLFFSTTAITAHKVEDKEAIPPPAAGEYTSFFKQILTASGMKNIKSVKAIEFKDLNYLSKYEIINLVDINLNKENIIIDINSLERVLSNLPIVKSFEITEMNQNLIISIVENEPVFLLCIRDREKNTLIELDKEFHIISVNRAHALNLPLILISKEEIKNSEISLPLQGFLRLIYDLQNSGLRIINDILEINYTNQQTIDITLKGRKTVFIIKPDRQDFYRLNYTAGYMDMIKYYPYTFTILDGFGIVTTQKIDTYSQEYEIFTPNY